MPYRRALFVSLLSLSIPLAWATPDKDHHPAPHAKAFPHATLTLPTLQAGLDLDLAKPSSPPGLAAKDLDPQPGKARKSDVSIGTPPPGGDDNAPAALQVGIHSTAHGHSDRPDSVAGIDASVLANLLQANKDAGISLTPGLICLSGNGLPQSPVDVVPPVELPAVDNKPTPVLDLPPLVPVTVPNVPQLSLPAPPHLDDVGSAAAPQSVPDSDNSVLLLIGASLGLVAVSTIRGRVLTSHLGR